jgi:DNA-binding NarL/FixJ family response regulator
MISMPLLTIRSAPIRVILADDHALVLQGLCTLLSGLPDIEVVAAVQNSETILTTLDEQAADVLVLDLQMPLHGFKVLAEIRRREIAVRVLVLTAFSDSESIRTAIELQADGYALKTEAPLQTIEAIRQVAQGRLVFPRAAQRWLAHPTTPDPLSPREREILNLTAKGHTNLQIAAALTLSENTVRFHLKNVYEKLNVANRTEATAWYLKNLER